MAGGRFKGLRSPDSGCAVSQRPAAQATVSSLSEVLVNRNDFFFFFLLMNKSQKTTLGWTAGDNWSQLQSGCLSAPRTAPRVTLG